MAQEYYLTHKTERLTYQKEYNAKNEEKIKEYQQHYYAETREEKKARQLAYNKAHREEIREYRKRIYRERISVNKVECECGSVVVSKNKKAHDNTIKHLEWLKNKQ